MRIETIERFLQRWWLLLPLLSALLLPFAFYPFDLWVIGFFALVPLFWFINADHLFSRKQVFWGGFLTSAIFSIVLSYFTVVQFHWLPQTYLFTTLARLSFIPIAAVCGLLGGGGAVVYRTFRTKSPIANLFFGPAVWVAVEWIIVRLLSGYDFGLMAYVAHDVPFLVSFASIGGAALVSFLVIFVNVAIVTVALYPTYYRVYSHRTPMSVMRSAALGVGVFVTVVVAIYFLNNAYLRSGRDARAATTTIALIQNQAKGDSSFGYFRSLDFSYPELEKLVEQANAYRPEFMVYPFSPYGGIVSGDGNAPPFLYKQLAVGTTRDFGRWVDARVNASSTFVTWGSVLRDKKPYNEVDFWSNGDVAALYQKRVPFPFMDYTPRWAESIGLYSIAYDLSAGPINQKPVTINGIRIGNLLCSELNKVFLARRDGHAADIEFAIGSEAMFVDDIAGNFHVIAAQFRAAENNRPVVRANRLGPSALINASGSVLARMDYGEEGILYGSLPYEKNPRNTVYSYVGDWGFMRFAFLLTAVVIGVRMRSKQFRNE